MKTKILLILLILALAVPLTAAPPSKMKTMPPASLVTDNQTWIDANNILMFVTNHGNFGRDLTDMFHQDGGTFFPFTTIDRILDGSQSALVNYASGLWIGGQVGGETRVTIAEYSDEYVPGPMMGTTFTPDAPEFHVYKLYKDSLADNPNSDYLNWPVADGAPVVDDGNGNMVPETMGATQMLWSVYNDADASAHTNDAGASLPLGLELRQATFAYDREDPLGNVIFTRLRVYNLGGNTIDNCYLSLWADPDLGGAGDDLVGCDIPLSLGYVYNATNRDSDFGATPPSMGYDFLQGPMVDAPGETARMWGISHADKKNLGMVSFNRYINGTDPNSSDESYNYMQGLDANGDPYIDPVTNEASLHMHSGDPVTGQGDNDFNGADRRFMQSTGPITFAPGDSTEIYAAIIVGQGSDRLSSISVMKYYDRFAQSAYDLFFNLPEPPATPVVTITNLPGEISMTWTDISEIDHGDYPFEGYTVYQGETPSGPWKRIANYDANNGTGTILDDVIDVETGTLELRGVKFGSDAGIKHHYFSTDDALLGGGLRNISTYYYKVEAYSHDPSATPKTLTSAVVLELQPQTVLAGTDLPTISGEYLSVTHPLGVSDGVVTVEVIDPMALNGHDYSITFTGDPSTADVKWYLTDLTTGEVLLDTLGQSNQSADTEYDIIDGFLVTVSGPTTEGVKTGDMFASNDPADWGWDIPSGNRVFTWAGGADGFGWEGFRGALGWGGPGDDHGFGSYSPIPSSTLNTVLLKLADVDANGVFDPNDENVSYAYRYLRGATSAPARPEFGPFIVDANPPGGSYGFQDFAKSMPLSAWNMDVEPPQRLAVGYLENNAINGLVDGKYWPGFYGDYDNITSSGPREWLWIYQDAYSETPVPAYQLNAIDDSMPVMYWATWARRNTNPWVTGDEFIIFPTRPNLVADVFEFTTTNATMTMSQDALQNIKVVPNPFYLYSSYDPSPGNHRVKFTQLPETCSISIYNLAGEFIERIEKDDATSIASWNANTSNGLPVASGIYLYVVEAPGYGQKIGKFAVFMEVEILKKF